MPVIAGDTMRLSFRGTCFGQRIILDLSYRCTVGAPGVATAAVLDETLTAVVGGGVNDIKTNYLACLPPQYTMNEVRAQIIKPVRSAFRSNTLVGFVGTNVNPATVACDSAASTRRTALSGRNQVSTLKIGPVPDGASAAGLLTVPYTALLAPLMADTIKTLLLPISTVQWVATILSPLGISTERDLVNGVIQPQSRVMTRRVVGRGE